MELTIVDTPWHHLVLLFHGHKNLRSPPGSLAKENMSFLLKTRFIAAKKGNKRKELVQCIVYTIHIDITSGRHRGKKNKLA